MTEIISQPNKQELVNDVVNKLRYFVRLFGIDSLFIVGGYCRSLFLGREWDINDIDIASAYDYQAMTLGGLFATEVANTIPTYYKRSGAAAVHYQSEFGDMKVEFQGSSRNSYMHNEEVKSWMRQQGIPDTPLMNNIYGRDFTINSLIFSLDRDQLFDPTDRAVKDFDKKIIKSLIPSDLLIKYNPLAALRAIRFSLQYDFYIDKNLREEIKTCHTHLAETLSNERIMIEIVRILKVDGPKGLEMIKKLGFDQFLLSPDVKKYINIEVTDD